MREDEFLKKGAHEGVAALVDEVADVGGHASPDELRAGQFVLGKDKKEETD